MKRTLIKWDSNWADEMDIQGFVIVPTEEANEFNRKLSELKCSFVICVGTNEEIDYDSGQDLLNDLDFTELTEEQYKVIDETIGEEYGHTSFYQGWWEEDDY